jgi:Helix-turn-helix domain
VTDLRDQLPAFEAAARRLIPQTGPIPVTHHSHLGLILRELRHRAGLSQNALARQMHITKSGLAAREQRPGMSVGAFIDHAQAVGYDVALIRRAGALTPDRRTVA